MNKKANEVLPRFDGLKWAVAVLVLCMGIAANFYFSAEPGAVRLVGWLVVTGVCLGVAGMTARGRQGRAFLREAHIEVRKVIWPTRDETIRMTLIVMGLIVIMTLILWGVDTILTALIRMILPQ